MDHRRGLTRSNLQKSLAKLAHMRLGSKSNPTKESTSKTSFISTLPFELREMIFSYCDFYNSWKPEFRWKRGRGRSAMPPLIIALRPLPIPYHHALAVFYRRNRYTLGEMNNYGFGWMLPSAIATIQCINIDVVSFYLPPNPNPKSKTRRLLNWKQTQEPDMNFPLRPWRTVIPHLNTSLREVSLQITRWELVTKQALMQTYVNDFPKFLAHIKDLKITYVDIPCWSFWKDGGWGTDNELIMRRYGRLIGSAHVRGFNGENEVQTWVFVARKGGALDWSKVAPLSKEDVRG